MTEPFVGEIRMFAGTFAPRSWAFCDGQLLGVSQNDALFSLLGTLYGGDGRTTFGLPDLRGRVPVHAGSGPGLTPRTLGAKAGSESATVTAQQLPSHSHTAQATAADADTPAAAGTVPALPEESRYRPGFGGDLVDLDPQAVGSAGGGQSHANVQPFLCVNFIIALFGFFPSPT